MRSRTGHWRRVAAHAAHDVGLAAWFGGALMGAVALNSATREVDDHTQRLRVADAGWFRWAPIAAVSIGVHLLGAAELRRVRQHGPADDLVRGTLTVVALLAAAESGRSGRIVVGAGDVPVATAVTPIDDTPDDVAAAMRRLRVGQWVVPAATGALWLVEATRAAATE